MLEILKKNWIIILFCLMLGVLTVLVSSAPFVLIKYYFSIGVSGGSSYIALFLAVMLIQRFMLPLLNGLSSFYYNRVAANSEKEVYRISYLYAAMRDNSHEKDVPTGEINHTVNSAINSCRSVFGNVFRIITSSGIAILVNILLLIVLVDWRVGCMAGICVLAYLLIGVLLMEKKEGIINSIREREGKVLSFLTDELIVKNKSKDLNSMRLMQFESLQDELLHAQKNNSKFMLVANVYRAFLILIAYLIFGLVILYFSVYLGAAILAGFLFGAAIFEAGAISTNWRSIVQARYDLMKLRNYYSIVGEGIRKVSRENEDCSQRASKIDVVIDNQSVVFSNGDSILFDVKLSVFSGKINMLSGGNGVGKSTLIDLLYRAFSFRENELKVSLIMYFQKMEQEETEIKKLVGESMSVCVVHQVDEFFNDTIFNNFKAVNSNLTIDCVMQYIELMRLGDRFDRKFVMNEKLGELGSSISGGERKRLSIGRALSLCPKILLLDEPFVGLDENSVNTLKEVFINIMDNTIILMVSHGQEIFDSSIIVDNHLLPINAGDSRVVGCKRVDCSM